MPKKKSKTTNVIIVNKVKFLGDSLSERGTVHAKSFLMDKLTIAGKSPKGRFCDSYVWTDYVVKAIFDAQEKKVQENDSSESSIDLSHHRKIHYKGEKFALCYAEGGSTAAEYAFELPSRFSFWNCRVAAARMMVSNLKKQREKLLADDKKYQTSDEEKQHTLIIEWSGVNDVTTAHMHDHMTDEYLNNIMESKINNIRELVRNGYRHFVLFNLPELSLVPIFKGSRYYKYVTARFNQLLESHIEDLKTELSIEGIKHVSIKLFNVNKKVEEIVCNPGKHGFNTKFADSAYLDDISTGKEPQEYEASAQGYLFYDYIHPSSAVHKKLSDVFLDELSSDYTFDLEKKPQTANQLYQTFIDAYMSTYGATRLKQSAVYQNLLSIDSRLKEQSSDQYYRAALDCIFKHTASFPSGDAAKIVKRLDWETSDYHPVLLEARENQERTMGLQML